MVGQLTAPLDSYRWNEGGYEEKAIFWTCVSLNASFLLTLVILLSGVEAPYGRYNQAGDTAERSALMRAIAACNLNAKLAWILQECPTLIAAAICWATGSAECKSSFGNILLMFCFVLHYTNRSIIYPLRMKGSKPTPLPLMLMALIFCAVNGYLQCRSLTRFLIIPADAVSLYVGVVIWGLGLYINHDADHILRNLRKPGETGYKIPHGGMFNYVSGANFFGEILEWCGFAIAMGGALPGVTFAWCTATNIGPRAIAHHKWYLQKFKDEYPKDRKALIPFVY